MWPGIQLTVLCREMPFVEPLLFGGQKYLGNTNVENPVGKCMAGKPILGMMAVCDL